MMDRVKQFLVLIFSAGVILVNYLSEAGNINGITLETISDKHLTLIAPASYAFSGWRVLSIGLVIFTVFQLLPSAGEKLSKTRTFFILACVANILTLYAWHYDLILMGLFWLLVAVFALVKISTDPVLEESPGTFWFVKVPLSVFFAWISLLLILNLAALFVSFGAELSQRSSFIIASGIIIAIAAAAIIIRHRISTFAYALTIAWGLTAVAVKQSGKTAIVVTCAIGVIALLISAFSFFIQDHEKPA